jgi:hypothetical protein
LEVCRGLTARRQFRLRKLVAFGFDLGAAAGRLPGAAWNALPRAGGPQQAQPERCEAPAFIAGRGAAPASPPPITVAADRARGDISQQ